MSTPDTTTPDTPATDTPATDTPATDTPATDTPATATGEDAPVLDNVPLFIRKLFYNKTFVYYISLLLTAVTSGAYIYLIVNYLKTVSILKPPLPPLVNHDTFFEPLYKKMPSVVWMLIPATIFILLCFYLIRNGRSMFDQHTIWYFLNLYIIVFIMMASVLGLHLSRMSSFFNSPDGNRTVHTAELKAQVKTQTFMLTIIGIASGSMWLWLSGVPLVLNLSGYNTGPIVYYDSKTEST